MLPPNLVVDEAVKRLALHLKTTIPILASVLEDFPEANQQLKYPCLSVLAGSVGEHKPRQPSILSSTVPNGANKTKVKYVVGTHDWSFQLDLWAGNKKERSALHEKIAAAFSAQFPVLGLSLTLENYHGIVCRYTLTDHKYGDNEAASQRKEWRSTFTVLVDCDEILEKEEFAIVQTQVTIETPDEIEEEI